jgi:sulfopyruvate decarboxylase TPP-binding subunit|tara:strand:+ start:1387 stop:1554 length:168 start_codon:yes stop_codon:yes gene_type:complete
VENVYQSAQTVVVLAQANVTMVVVVPTMMINAVLTQVEKELAVIVIQKILAVNTH